MLTRGQVARRLGRSLATVRRLEGVELHPWRDERGIHRFEPIEVERLARAKGNALRAWERPEVGSWSTTHAEAVVAERDADVETSTSDQVSDLLERMRSLEQRVTEAESDRDERRLSNERHERLEEELAELQASMLTDLVLALESLSGRQLRRIRSQDLALLEDLLEMA